MQKMGLISDKGYANMVKKKSFMLQDCSRCPTHSYQDIKENQTKYLFFILFEPSSLT